MQPGPELAELEEDILNHRVALGDRADRKPAPVGSLVGTAPVPGLPRYVDAFVRSDEQHRRQRDTLDTNRLVTMVGPAGDRQDPPGGGDHRRNGLAVAGGDLVV